jgi:DNA-binding SARP family transcriptional activator
VAIGGPAGERLAEAERWLRPGQRLVFASDRRRAPGAVPRSVISPQELLLTAGEVGSLWHLLTGIDVSPEAAQTLLRATDGWYHPLRLALEATGGMGLAEAGAEEILEVSAVRLFFRHEVLDVFPEGDRALLLDAPRERPGRGEEGEEAWRLLDEHGLWVEGPDRDCMPVLLAAVLERERRRRRPARPRGAAPVPGRAAMTSRGPAPALPVSRPLYMLGLLGSPIARERDEEGERELDCRLKRSFQVLAFLAASSGLQAGREELIEAVWPNEGERTIERNFHPTLSHLRRALEGGNRGDRKDRPAPLLFKNGVYRLNPEVTWEIDAIELSRLAEEGRERAARDETEVAADAWKRAWKLYRGPFLQGYYEAWVTARREEYQRLYLDLLRDLGDLYVRLGKNEDAMDAYRTVLVEDPLQERIHLAVMRLYAAQGRRDLVRRQYDNLCRLLLEELGVAPMPQTTRDYHRLMA